MINDILNERNVPNGVLNREIRHMSDRLLIYTEEGSLVWTKHVQAQPDCDANYKANLGKYAITVGMKNGHPTFLLEDTNEARVVARLDPEYPPDMSVRARLSGDVFGLIMFVDHQ